MEKRSSKLRSYAVVILLIWALLSSIAASWLYMDNERLRNDIRSLSDENDRLKKDVGSYVARLSKINFVDVVIDYGNGTVRVYREVPVPRSRSTVFQALLSVASVRYIEYPFGIWVDSIDGIANDPMTNMYWIYYVRVKDTKDYVMGEVAANLKLVSDGDEILWRYTKF
ncbi:MAG: DUF4430 domain-containing protein [Candidatus Bathyarchaeia archaeon]|nr:DUF4430 domain-containing protein [Candidatus Bathyarchaeota archaeon]